MRIKVRPVEPPTDPSGLEEFVVEPLPDADLESDADGDGPDGATTSNPRPSAAAMPKQPRRHVTAADLGPNGDRVADLLGRAARLTPDGVAGWRRRPAGAGGR